MTLWNRTAQDLLEATTSHQPTPGGGSVAALSGAFGVGLVCMALNITRRKQPEQASALREPLESLLGLQAELRTLADRDVQVFRAYVDASRLPRDTDEDKQARRAALDRAGQQARDVPLRVAQVAVEGLTLAGGVLEQTHPEVQSDVGAGAGLLLGSLHASLLTLDINLRHLDEEQRRALEEQRDFYGARGEALATQVLARTRELLQ
ncbi:cyclodeaminase/cyclohydrolase family protein [Deinococcus deserti]|uniref:Putative methenyltetrahydrofolate cyclohydrolase n=1 Tax=Deinococcus deserti (strain DSM 17065 / CIP 109153 / LMG 22923 / VCD115) TaxID=546414 RepID=C1CY71_DEIDV|nr:cyclodeaminase/cyclohydrolase family protein [Deinococcus deserti]ACO47027.1 putative methenyltetrahydrofolate cyclohydrolase [Deinococcus deserti VCD115]